MASKKAFHGNLYTHHVSLADEPLDERDEGRDDGGVAHLFDDQHAQGRLVPC